jgi:outer membrane biosynthesis protein TonB
MKKVLTTVVGLFAFAVIGSACSPAVDTQEVTSTTPVSIAAGPVHEAIELRHDPVSRSVERPKATPKPKVVPQPKVVKKVTKPIHKTVKPKKVYHKTVKVHKKVTHKTKYVPSTKKVRIGGIAACIAKYESGGNPRAQNPHSSASGLYQFIDGTWNNFGGYSRAMYAPVSVQTQKFYIVWNGGKGAGNWVVAHKCGY